MECNATKLREHRIVASPSKTELAFPELNILGQHTIDENGVKFDKNKLQSYLSIHAISKKFPQKI